MGVVIYNHRRSADPLVTLRPLCSFSSRPSQSRVLLVIPLAGPEASAGHVACVEQDALLPAGLSAQSSWARGAAASLERGKPGKWRSLRVAGWTAQGLVPEGAAQRLFRSESEHPTQHMCPALWPMKAQSLECFLPRCAVPQGAGGLETLALAGPQGRSLELRQATSLGQVAPRHHTQCPRNYSRGVWELKWSPPETGAWPT